jgi:hypothetical protein
MLAMVEIIVKKMLTKMQNFKASWQTYTDKNILDGSCLLVTHFPDFPLWEY